jgi:aryl-alcohol dehydrogenase (NADP+)
LAAAAGNNRGCSRKHLFQSLSESLQRLDTPYIDLFQLHRWDYQTPIEETMEALNDMVRSGKVLHVGASSMYCWQLAKANTIAERNGWTKFVSMQNHYNLIYREEEREVIPYCADQGMAVLPWSPLARGILTNAAPPPDETTKVRFQQANIQDKISSDVKLHQSAQSALSQVTTPSTGLTLRSLSDFNRSNFGYFSENDVAVRDRLLQLSQRLNKKPATVALAWLLNKPAVTAPIIGATKLSHLDDAVAAVSLKLSKDEMKSLEELYKAKMIFGHL